MKNCPNCGTANQDNAEFCTNCGAKLPAAAGAPRPPSAPTGPAPAAPPPGSGYQPAGAYGIPGETSGKATASLVLGIIGLFVCPIVCSIAALLLGYQAKSEIAASQGRLGGEGNATAGIILGWVGLALYTLAIIVWVIIALVVGANSLVLFL
jgi:hypothetical protein